jgi:hypothetical protein
LLQPESAPPVLFPKIVLNDFEFTSILDGAFAKAADRNAEEAARSLPLTTAWRKVSFN